MTNRIWLIAAAVLAVCFVLPLSTCTHYVDAKGEGVVREQRLYQLVRQRGTVTEHTFEITFLDAWVQAYAFTFG